MTASVKHLVLFVRIVQKNMEPLPFEQFEGKYSIVEQLGRGASGICFHVITKEERKHFALKKIPLQLIEPRKLNNEISILSSISHPNIIRLQQSYISKEFLYLLFDYNHERDLQKMIKQREKNCDCFPESFIWALLKKVLQALQYLHEKNIIHRDIKPSNIFVNTEDNSLQIGDLGTAKIAENENYSRIGTPLYLPPEIIKYESYSEKIDVWSLGVTIFQLAALKPPFHNSNFIKLAQSITYEEPVYPAHFSKKLASCIKDMLRKDHFKRPTCKQLLEAYCQIETNQLSQKEIQVNGSELQVMEENNQKEQEWKVELISEILIQSRGNQKKMGSQMSLFEEKQAEQQQVMTIEMQKMESMRRGSLKKVASIKEVSAKQLLNLPQLEDSDQTIVLQVNPNDYNNFCGYYRQSPRPSKIHFKSETSGACQLKMGRKSSLFKQIQANDSFSQPFSNFKVNHNNGHQKENSKTMVSHKRQQSGICRKQRHEELMSKLKALKKEDQAVQASNLLQKPKLIIIDQRTLLIGQGNISDKQD